MRERERGKKNYLLTYNNEVTYFSSARNNVRKQSRQVGRETDEREDGKEGKEEKEKKN